MGYALYFVDKTLFIHTAFIYTEAVHSEPFGGRMFDRRAIKSWLKRVVPSAP
jgi:hypothetical protein